MSDKLENPLLNDDHRPSPFHVLENYRHLIPYLAISLVTVIGFAILIYFYTDFISSPLSTEITSLKNQTAIINDRVNRLEESLKSTETPSIDLAQIKQIEARISSLSQQIEAIKNQPKVEATTQQLEKSQNMERDLNHLAETQNNLKSYLLFLRLKAIVLSNNPYRTELNDFKISAKHSEGISYLEKFADQGLQILKANQVQDIVDSAPSNSWWNRLIFMVSSFIKIEKVGEQPTSPSRLQEHHDIEEVLNQMEQSLILNLNAIPANSTPQSGDVL